MTGGLETLLRRIARVMSASAEHFGDKPHTNGGRSLASILDEKNGDSDVEDRQEADDEEEEKQREVPAGLCVECEGIRRFSIWPYYPALPEQCQAAHLYS